MDQKPNTAEPKKPRRRWFQFRLRTLLIGMMLLSVPLGDVAHELRIVAERKAWFDGDYRGGTEFPDRGLVQSFQRATRQNSRLSSGDG